MTVLEGEGDCLNKEQVQAISLAFYSARAIAQYLRNSFDMRSGSCLIPNVLLTRVLEACKTKFKRGKKESGPETPEIRTGFTMPWYGGITWHVVRQDASL